MNGIWRLRSLAALAACVATVGACRRDDDRLELTFSPGTIATSLFQGQSQWFAVDVTLSKEVQDAAYVIIEDPEGVLGPELSISPGSSTQFYAYFWLSRSLGPGSHRGALKVYLCRDSACQSPEPGAPWLLPYDITIQGFDLEPLAPLAGVSDWLTSGGDSTHSGYVPAAIDPSSIGRRWWLDPSPDLDHGTSFMSMSEVAVESGRAFLAFNPMGYPTTLRPQVRALSENTGEVLWTYTASSAPEYTHFFAPSASGGRVFVSYNGNGLLTLDAVTGAVVLNATVPTGVRIVGRATPSGDYVFVPCVESGSSIDRCDAVFDAASGAYLRRITGNKPWEPNPISVASGNLLLTLGQQQIRAINPADGTVAWEYLSPTSFWSATPLLGQKPELIVSKPEGFVCTATGVVCIDTGTREATPFTLPYGSQIIAFVKGVVYAARSDNPFSVNPNVLDAYDFATGALLWSWTDGVNLNAIVTDNLIFMGHFALDLSTREVVWHDEVGGALAISANGVLYVTGGSNANVPPLVTFNLSALQ